ncbi:hypothetical protein A2Y85_03130 [candidate division WOR-3 bacterium RBG_13_43_14]|uniref:Protein BatD n=1 Tax=candidate division WOR-3 bacterium RBG_13_43_14 TaxID=1802590 RepID=A0A1F4UDB3_UNCW3|nr:MAG: hypothetical protein A2Y85_03130 [candidate division WOR-3 bacterium RBG_13_43_14]
MLRKIGSCLFASIIFLSSASLNFTASVNRSEVGINEPLTLTVMVEGENIGNVPSPQLPELPDFTIGGRSSSQSTNIQLINGKLTQQQTISFIYTLYPKETGTKTIGACKLEFKGETYQTQPLGINVVKDNTKPPPGPGPGAAQTSADQIKDKIKLIATVDRKSVYVGEQINVEFNVYTNVRADYGNFEKPNFNDFWVEPVFDAQQVNYETVTFEGKQYSKFPIKKAALFPIQDGQLQITSMKLTAIVPIQPTSFFDFGRSENIELKSNPIYIEVKPLPEENKPREFCGGIGKFSVTANLDEDSSNAAEPINLRIRISGTGNVRTVQKPDLPTIPGLKILDPEVKDQTQMTDNKIQGYKEFLYPIIPQIDGEHVIPSIRIAYFDPSDNKYHIRETNLLKFVATQTAVASQTASSNTIKTLGADINHIKADQKHLPDQRFNADWKVSIFYILSILIIGIAFIYRRHSERLLTDRAYARKIRSSRITRQGIQEAEKALKKNDMIKFYSALTRSLEGYVGDRFNLDTGALTKEQIANILGAKGVQAELITDLIKIITRCDQSRFSRGPRCDNPREIMNRAKQIIKEL